MKWDWEGEGKEGRIYFSSTSIAGLHSAIILRVEPLISIGQASEILNRKPGTIRKWEREGVLPDECIPTRDERGRRFFTLEQVDKIKEWIKETDRRAGKGLPYYNPTFEQAEAQVEKMRTSHSKPKLL